MYKKNKKILRQIQCKTGFTLIELIVTMTIIMIVTVVGIVSYTGSTKRARDSRRISDLQKIALALEMYRQGVGSSYPGNLSSLTPNYLQAIPVGPKGENYTYTATVNYTYRICAQVEGLGSTSVDSTGCSGAVSPYVGNYRVTNP